MSRTIRQQLSNCFINARGEVCSNLATSRSKVAVTIRNAERKRSLIREKRNLERDVRNLEAQRDKLRKEGLTLGAIQREGMFKRANTMHQRSLDKKARLLKVVKELNSLS
jgi:hypothetical protein